MLTCETKLSRTSAGGKGIWDVGGRRERKDGGEETSFNKGEMESISGRQPMPGGTIDGIDDGHGLRNGEEHALNGRGERERGNTCGDGREEDGRVSREIEKCCETNCNQ